MKRINRPVGVIVAGLVVLGVVIQFIPYGRDHTNPPVLQEPAWDSPQTRELAQRACFDCHSNETVWPWYSNIAPVSWLIYNDVSEGREHYNLSEWDIHPTLPEDEGEGEEHQHGSDVVEHVLLSGEMPPASYLLLHPEARLSEVERQKLIEGLAKSTAE